MWQNLFHLLQILGLINMNKKKNTFTFIIYTFGKQTKIKWVINFIYLHIAAQAEIIILTLSNKIGFNISFAGAASRKGLIIQKPFLNRPFIAILRFNASHIRCLAVIGRISFGCPNHRWWRVRLNWSATHKKKIKPMKINMIYLIQFTDNKDYYFSMRMIHDFFGASHRTRSDFGTDRAASPGLRIALPDRQRSDDAYRPGPN